MRFAEFHPIETERLLLRQLTMEDVYEYYERLFGDGDVARYMEFEWRIPWTEEPGGLQSMGSHRVGHD